MTTHLCTSPCVNPFYCNGKNIEFIEFTQNGQPLGCIYCGWFSGSNNHYKEVILPFEVKNKRTYSNKMESFIIKATEHGTTGYKLVIPVELLPEYTITEKVRGYKTEDKIQYFTRISFAVDADKVEPIKDDIKGYIWKRTGIKKHTITADFNFTIEQTEIGLQRDELSKLAQSVGVNLSLYDIKRLQEVFNISAK